MTGPELNNVELGSAQDFQHFAERRMSRERITLATEQDLEIVVNKPTTLKDVQHSNNVTELATAHAAVVLAKAQAAASRQVELELRQDVKLLKQSLDIEAQERSALAAELEVARQQFIDVDKELAIEKTKLSELRKQADQEHYERLRLAKRIEQIEDRKRESFMTRFIKGLKSDKDTAGQ